MTASYDTTHPAAADDQWANEQRRRWMVSQLGIANLVSRYDAPGARPTTRWRPPESAAKATSVSTEGRVRPSTALPYGQKVVAGEPVSALNATPDAKPGLASAAQSPMQSPVQSAPAFSLLLARAGNWLWVEYLPDRLIRSEQLHLLAAMARALSGAPATFEHRQFDWPINDNPNLPRDHTAARQSIAGLLGRWRQGASIAGTVLLGESAEGYVEITEESTVLRLPSTSKMLSDTRLKRDAWAVMRPHAVKP
ncbi:conserved hypothetical protein [Luminiphilus syltensis NOR5-1B]|uniref:Uncharacterized protein n=1 Tax=Luminiphilus syltensis NOR5-1B TaxID=565045 RepID=B8KQE2_9GAMM|nr:hypothetical protein [Luminiphilus syltensis]EED36072.1 conserved hypothetical protein [Luminiphilus syltensis NOR5-1B]